MWNCDPRDMSEQDFVVKCSADVLVNYVESLHVYTGLLTVATVCGGLSGILAAALLYVFCLKTLILTRQVSNRQHTTFSIYFTGYNFLRICCIPSGGQCKEAS